MEGIELLREAADVLARLDPATLSDEELGEALVAWHRLDNRLAATRCRLTAAFEARRAYASDGSKSAAAWLARKTHGSPAAMRAQTRLARRLWRMPATTAALAAGDISERHAEILAALAWSARKPVADAFTDAEAKLVEYARTLGFDEFVVAVRYWESLVDEDGAEEQAASDHAARYLHLSQAFRGNWVLDGQLDPLTGEEIHTELRRLERELFDADWAAAKAIHGDTTRLEDLERTPAQRRADALREMARRSAATPANPEPCSSSTSATTASSGCASSRRAPSSPPGNSSPCSATPTSNASSTPAPPAASSTWGADPDSSPAPSAAPSNYATDTAPNRAATPPPTSATPTTSSPTPTADAPTRPTANSSAPTTTDTKEPNPPD